MDHPDPSPPPQPPPRQATPPPPTLSDIDAALSWGEEPAVRESPAAPLPAPAPARPSQPGGDAWSPPAPGTCPPARAPGPARGAPPAPGHGRAREAGAPVHLSYEIAHSDPLDPAHQTHLLARIRAMRASMPADAHSDLAANLNMASMLSQYLVRMGGIGPEDVLQIVARLVSEVELAFREPDQARPQGHVVLEAQHASTGGLSLVGCADAEKGRLLGEILIQLGAATPEQVAQALRVQKATGVRLGEALVGDGVVTWAQIEKAVAVQRQFKDS